MTFSNHSEPPLSRSHGVWTLFDYLLSEMGGSAYAQGLRYDHKLTEDQIALSLAETAASLGLTIIERTLTLEQAVNASGNLALLIKPLADSNWLVLSGFRRGKIEVGLIKGALVETHLVKSSELIELLQINPDHLTEWYSIQLEEAMDASSHHDAHHLPPMQRLFAMMKVEKQDLWRVVILAIASGMLSLATPAAVQFLVNTVALGGMAQPLTVLSLILFIFLTFYGAVAVLQSYIVELLQRRVFLRMTADLAYRLPRIKWAVYDHKNGAELVNRFFDILTVQKAGAYLLLEGFSMALQSIIGLLVLAAYHPLLMIFNVIVLVWLGIVIFFQGRNGVETSIKESVAKYSVVAWLETLARNGQTFKFSGGPEFALERAEKLAYDYFTTRKRHYQILLRQHISLYALYALASTGLLAVGGMLVIDGQLSLGQLVAAELIVSGVLYTFSKLKKQLESYYDLMAGVDKLGHLLDLPTERDDGEALLLTQPPGLAVYDLSFSYPDHPAQFKALSFDIKPGEKVALLGGLGSGKSTLADLLTGLRFPSEGRIEINHLDLRELQLDSVRKHIAVIGGAEIIEDTLLENIRLNRPEISVNAVRATLNRLGLLNELVDQREGLYTLLSHTGSPLSSSQIRKILLARAIVGDPKLLIIDGLLDDWPNFGTSKAHAALFSPESAWTLLVLTSSKTIAQCCQRTIELKSS